jgi:hypothetical protein
MMNQSKSLNIMDFSMLALKMAYVKKGRTILTEAEYSSGSQTFQIAKHLDVMAGLLSVEHHKISILFTSIQIRYNFTRRKYVILYYDQCIPNNNNSVNLLS